MNASVDSEIINDSSRLITLCVPLLKISCKPESNNDNNHTGNVDWENQNCEALSEEKKKMKTTKTSSGCLPSACSKRKYTKNVYARVHSADMIASQAMQILFNELYIVIAM